MQYEMMDLYLTINAGNEQDDDMHVYLLEYGIGYFNQCFKTSLKVNYNYKAQGSGDGEVENLLAALAIERQISSKKPRIATFHFTPEMKILTIRRVGSSQGLKCPKEHGIPCYCPPQRMFRSQFFGSNIYAIFAIEENVKCFVCDKQMKLGQLQQHFQKDCTIFNPVPASANLYAA